MCVRRHLRSKVSDHKKDTMARTDCHNRNTVGCYPFQQKYPRRRLLSRSHEWRERIAAIVLLCAALPFSTTSRDLIEAAGLVAFLTQFEHTQRDIGLLAPIPVLQGSDTRGDHAERVRIGDYIESL